MNFHYGRSFCTAINTVCSRFGGRQYDDYRPFLINRVLVFKRSIIFLYCLDCGRAKFQDEANLAPGGIANIDCLANLKRGVQQLLRCAIRIVLGVTPGLVIDRPRITLFVIQNFATDTTR